MNSYSYNYGYDYSSAYAAGAAASTLSSLFSLAISILSIVAMWKIFVKAGEEGWKAIIPLYSTYILFKLTWKTKMFWIFLGCLIGGAFLGTILTVVGVAMESVGLAVLGGLLMFAGIIAAAVIGIMSKVKLANAFGKNGGFSVGMVFLGTIFTCILAFDKSIEYVGPQC